jgi:hypothetical protein
LGSVEPAIWSKDNPQKGHKHKVTILWDELMGGQ